MYTNPERPSSVGCPDPRHPHETNRDLEQPCTDIFTDILDLSPITNHNDLTHRGRPVGVHGHPSTGGHAQDRSKRQSATNTAKREQQTQDRAEQGKMPIHTFSPLVQRVSCTAYCNGSGRPLLALSRQGRVQPRLFWLSAGPVGVGDPLLGLLQCVS